MGYTTFAVEPKDFAADAKTVTVTAVVKNTGTIAGKEVVQVYYSARTEYWTVRIRSWQALQKRRSCSRASRRK